MPFNQKNSITCLQVACDAISFGCIAHCLREYLNIGIYLEQVSYMEKEEHFLEFGHIVHFIIFFIGFVKIHL